MKIRNLLAVSQLANLIQIVSQNIWNWLWIPLNIYQILTRRLPLYKVQRFITLTISWYQLLDSDHKSWRKCQDFQHWGDILCLHSTHLHKGTRPSINVITRSRNIIAPKIYEHVAPALASLNPYHQETKLHVHVRIFIYLLKQKPVIYHQEIRPQWLWERFR